MTTTPDFSDIYAKYEALVARVDELFNAVKERSGEAVTCHEGCSDCCHAVFDLSLVEAMYLNKRFQEDMDARADEPLRQQLLANADRAERGQVKVVRKAQKRQRAGDDPAEILADVAARRVRCPLLTAEDKCELYDARPITCRLYGVPQAIGGQAHSCGLSGFEPGGAYPTVNVEKIQDALVELSELMVTELKTKYPGLATMHIPLATALLTSFNDEFLGVVSDDILGDDEVETMHTDPFSGPARAGEEAGPVLFEEQPGECTGCDKSDCQGCPSASDGCGGEPTIIEFGGPQPDGEPEVK